jgi:hypothetical protein
MLAKSAKDRPSDMWEFLKEFRALKLFKKPPRRPGAAERENERES